MEEKLNCPHNRKISIVFEKGLVVYRHSDDNSYCQMLNNFETTVDEILLMDMETLLKTHRYESSSVLGAGIDKLKQISLLNDGCIIEFIMIFRYSEEARERIFREIAILCKEEPFITNLYAQKLFYLVLSILTDSTVRSDERIYQRILEQLYRAIGLQLELLLEVLAGVCIKFDPAIVQIVNKLNFIKKYVYPLRDKDNYVIAIR